MQSVSSNAVANMFGNAFSNDFSIAIGSSSSATTATCNGILYVSLHKTNTYTTSIVEDTTPIAGTDLATGGSVVSSFTIFIRKGHSYYITNSDSGATINWQHFIKIS